MAGYLLDGIEFPDIIQGHFSTAGLFNSFAAANAKEVMVERMVKVIEVEPKGNQGPKKALNLPLGVVADD